MPMYTRKSGSRRYHFVEDNLHFPGKKKKVSAGEEKVIGRRYSRDVEHI